MITVTIRNRKGRKRKSGRRTSSGSLAREQIDYRALAAEQPHRRHLPPDMRLSEKAGSILGSLNLLNVITDEQYEAGRRFSTAYGAYLSTISPPKSTAGQGRGISCPPDSVCERNPEQCECLIKRTKLVLAAKSCKDAGEVSYRIVQSVAIEDQPCPGSRMADLRRGLDALAKHFGIGS